MCSQHREQLGDRKVKPVLYNGTNADDQLDPTRLGLVAASKFEVVSPLSQLTKSEVREVCGLCVTVFMEVVGLFCSRLSYGLVFARLQSTSVCPTGTTQHLRVCDLVWRSASKPSRYYCRK